MILIAPDWPAPPNVRAYASTRAGGLSNGDFRSLNISDRVGDEPALVKENRRRLIRAAGMPSEPAWLVLEHGTRVVSADTVRQLQRFHSAAESRHADPPIDALIADASYTRSTGSVCIVTMADCLPALICDRDGTLAAAVHCGWRGLAAGILEQTVATIGEDPKQLIVWLGPAIGGRVYEVGEEVRHAFVRSDANAQICFTPSQHGRWLADLSRLATQRLQRMGIGQISASELCTYSDPQRFFSFRRDGRCGRMASFIWLEPIP